MTFISIISLPFFSTLDFLRKSGVALPHWCSSEGPLRVLRFFGCQVRLAAKLGIFRQTLWHFRKKIFMADDHHQRLIVFRHVPNLDFMTIVSLHVKRILVSPLFHLQSPLFVIRIYYAFGHYLQGLPADTCSALFYHFIFKNRKNIPNSN